MIKMLWCLTFQGSKEPNVTTVSLYHNCSLYYWCQCQPQKYKNPTLSFKKGVLWINPALTFTSLKTIQFSRLAPHPAKMTNQCTPVGTIIIYQLQLIFTLLKIQKTKKPCAVSNNTTFSRVTSANYLPRSGLTEINYFSKETLAFTSTSV